MKNNYLIIGLTSLLVVFTACKKEDLNETSSSLKFKSCQITGSTENQKNRFPATYASPTFNPNISCYFPTSPITCRLQFGYTNPYSTQNYPVGTNNNFTYPSGAAGCSGQNCGQPTSFPSGTYPLAFPLTASKPGNYKWTIKGASVTGSCGTSLPRCAPLAVKFSNVKASWDNSHMVNVMWTTETESNNSYFIVQMTKPCRVNGEKIDVAMVPTKAIDGESSNTLNYSSKVAVDEGGIYSFNIIQVDKNGSRESSITVTVPVGH